MAQNARRTVLCPRCDKAMDVSVNAKSLPCAGCGRTFRAGDESVDDYQARREWYTEGAVEVGKKGIIIADVRVRSLVVKGEIQGPVKARESVQIAKTGKVTGDVTCRTLSMQDGAKLVGHVEFGPHADELKPPAPAPRAEAV